MYLLFMKECGLIMTCPVNNESSAENVVVDAPCITTGRLNKLGYNWDDFFVDYHSSPFMEMSFMWINKRK